MYRLLCVRIPFFLHSVVHINSNYKTNSPNTSYVIFTKLSTHGLRE